MPFWNKLVAVETLSIKENIQPAAWIITKIFMPLLKNL
jgi:hypothetical protein